jgi:DNA-binding MarR family transcriptional regulator
VRLSTTSWRVSCSLGAVSTRLFTGETPTGRQARGALPEVRLAMLEFVGEFLLDFERAARRAGLTLAQARVLGFAVLKPSSMREIAEQFGSDPSNITAKVDRLLQLGLVERLDDPADGRIKLVTATEQGRQLGAELCSSREWIAEILGRLSDDEVDTVQTALTLLLRHDAEATQER